MKRSGDPGDPTDVDSRGSADPTDVDMVLRALFGAITPKANPNDSRKGRWVQQVRTDTLRVRSSVLQNLSSVASATRRSSDDRDPTDVDVYMLFTLWDSATHGDRENREQAAAAALSCPQKKVRISGDRAEGCGRACELSTTGSSASWFSAYVCNLDPSAKS